ncbi:MAG: class I SAM-dependent methyltransferase, partial [Ferruginibacter sp.]
KDKTWDADNEAMVKRFLTETDETMDAIKTKIIFDAGCGNGKLDSLLAANGATILGMDFANCIEEAYARNEFRNAHFIQGDVQYPPVISEHFDIVHCSGVLIHTNNAELSFSCIEPTVKPGGKLSVWLYHPRKDLIHNTFNFIRRFTSKLPLGFQYYLYAVTIFPVSYCIKKLKGSKQNSREMMVDILDWLTPEFRSEHEHAEATAWYDKRGYKNTRITTVNNFGFNIVGEK